MPESEIGEIIERRYAEGHFGYLAEGDQKYGEAAQRAFRKAIQIIAQFDEKEFVSEMRKECVPDDKIFEYMASLHINDDTYHVASGERWPGC